MDTQIQRQKIQTGKGFIAALDQSGGSTPRALRNYGIAEDPNRTEDQMFDLVHGLRTRIALSPDFTGEKIIGAILFQKTVDRDIEGKPSARFLWEERGIVPFLKVDQGLVEEKNGVQLMKEIAGLETTLKDAREKTIFGTKMRAVINSANQMGISELVQQQMDVAEVINTHGLMPIIEPEVTISISDKEEAEIILRDALLDAVSALPEDRQVMLKLTLPETANRYKALVDHPRVLRVVALSGGYSRDDANIRLARNTGMIASYSRGLSEGLMHNQSDDDFNRILSETINLTVEASNAG